MASRLANLAERARKAINRIPLFSEKEKWLVQTAMDAQAETVLAGAAANNTLLLDAVETGVNLQLQDLATNANIWVAWSSNVAQSVYPRINKFLFTSATPATFTLYSWADWIADRIYITNTAADSGNSLDLVAITFQGFQFANGGSADFDLQPDAGETLYVNGASIGTGVALTVSPGEVAIVTRNPLITDALYVSHIEAGGGGGSGDVTKVGTPLDDQVGVWTGDGTIEGTSGLTKTATQFTAGNYAFNIDQTVGAGQDNYVLTYDDASGEIGLEASAGGGGGLDNVVEDTTPELGGDLDVLTNSIVSSSGRDIAITPDTTGSVVLDGLSWPQTDGGTGHVLQTNGAGVLSFTAIAAGSSPSTGYGSIYADSNATTTTFSGASTDWTNKVQVTVFDTNGASSSGVTPDHTNDHVTVSNAGPYLLHASISFSGGSSDTLSFAFFKNNGATQLGNRTTRKLGTGGDVGACDISAAVDLSASDTVELWVQNESDTDAITIQDINFEVVGLTGLGSVIEDPSPQLGGALDVNGNTIYSASGVDLELNAGSTANIILDGMYFPNTAGSNGQILSTNGSATLSWIDPPAAGATTLLALTDFPSSFVANKWMKVNGAANAVEFVDSPVTSVSASSPLVKTGTSTVSLSIPVAAGPSTDGYMTGAMAAKLAGIENLADVTDTANVTAAGAVMDDDVGGNGIVVRATPGNYGVRALTSSNGDVTFVNATGVGGNPDLTVAGIGGKQVTISATAPTSPSVNDVWIDIS